MLHYSEQLLQPSYNGFTLDVLDILGEKIRTKKSRGVPCSAYLTAKTISSLAFDDIDIDQAATKPDRFFMGVIT